MLAEDAEALAAAGPDRLDGGARHVRLLPPYDPFLLGADREALVAEPEARKVLWRAIGNPGAVIRAGSAVAAWRAAASGGRLTVTLTPLPGAGPAVRAGDVADEAERVCAGTRGLVKVAVG